LHDFLVLYYQHSKTIKHTEKYKRLLTPLLHEVPSGRSTEFTLQGPMSHWQVSTVTLASKPKRFRISKKFRSLRRSGEHQTGTKIRDSSRRIEK